MWWATFNSFFSVLIVNYYSCSKQHFFRVSTSGLKVKTGTSVTWMSSIMIFGGLCLVILDTEKFSWLPFHIIPVLFPLSEILIFLDAEVFILRRLFNKQHVVGTAVEKITLSCQQLSSDSSVLCSSNLLSLLPWRRMPYVPEIPSTKSSMLTVDLPSVSRLHHPQWWNVGSPLHSDLKMNINGVKTHHIHANTEVQAC
jgi:hypothetical protein